MKKKLYGAIVVGVVLFVVIILAAASIKRQLNDWKLLPEPERLTELYFTHPNNLPSNYTAGQNQTVSFTVHNLEYRTTNYTYKITEQAINGGPTDTLATGDFSLKQNQYKHPAVNISLADLGSNVKVSVYLENQAESIDYLLTKESS